MISHPSWGHYGKIDGKYSNRWFPSKYYGVGWRNDKWMVNAPVIIRGRIVRKYLGSFDDEVEAAKAYDEHCLLNKIEVSLNFPINNHGT